MALTDFATKWISGSDVSNKRAIQVSLYISGNPLIILIMRFKNSDWTNLVYPDILLSEYLSLNIVLTRVLTFDNFELSNSFKTLTLRSFQNSSSSYYIIIVIVVIIICIIIFMLFYYQISVSYHLMILYTKSIIY